MKDKVQGQFYEKHILHYGIHVHIKESSGLHLPIPSSESYQSGNSFGPQGCGGIDLALTVCVQE